MALSPAQKYDIALVSQDSALMQRVAAMGAEYSFTVLNVPSVDDLLDKYSEATISFVIISAGNLEKKEDAVGLVQVTRQVLQGAFIFISVGKRMDSKSADFIRMSGADAVVLEEELMATSKLEFMAVQRLKAAYLAVKGADFLVNTKVDFPVYALLPANKKYMPIVHKGMTIDPPRLKKMEGAGDLFVKRDDVAEFHKYTTSLSDSSAEGLMRRCRAEYMSLAVSFADLVLQLTDQIENASFVEGRENLARCEKLAGELLSSLMAVGKIWDVVSQSVIGEFGSLERSPTRAAYAGFLSLMSSIGKPEDMMLATLLSDIGLLQMNPGAIRKIREKRIADMTADERADYITHPQRSVNVVASRKVPLNQTVRDAIFASHAQFDGKGFPEIRPDKISLEAQMVQFVEKLDLRCLVEIGKPRPEFKAELKKLIQEEIDSSQVFNGPFLMALNKIEL